MVVRCYLPIIPIKVMLLSDWNQLKVTYFIKSHVLQLSLLNLIAVFHITYLH